jgi:microcompartment protein CcmK/EutM
LKLLYVQPLDVRSRAAAGDKLIAVDAVDAGPGDLVLVIEEGRSSWQAVGKELAPINRAVIGVVDAIEWFSPAGGPADGPPGAPAP